MGLTAVLEGLALGVPIISELLTLPTCPSARGWSPRAWPPSPLVTTQLWRVLRMREQGRDPRTVSA